MTEKLQNKITFSSLGIVAYMFTDVAHEVIGHTGTAFLLGIKTVLLTSVYYRSSPGYFIVSLGGPAANLIFAALLFFILKQRKNISFQASLLLTLFLAYNLFWFSGTMLDSGFNSMEDFAWGVKMLHIGTFGKPLLIVGGFVSYIISVRIVRPQIAKINLRFPGFPLKEGIYYSYFAAVIVAVIAGSLFAPDRIHAAFEGLLEMVASIPILFLAPKNEVKNYTAKPNYLFYVTVGILYVAFCLTLGMGIYS